MVSWSTKRQLFYLLIFLFFVFTILTGVYFGFFRKQPSCFDGTLNQDELGIDCGGSCQAVCVTEVSSPVKRWVRVFKTRNGLYDVAALIENTNKNIGAGEFKYSFQVHDQNALLITEKSGTIFLNPNERMVIFESNIDMGKRIPGRAFVSFDSEDQNWQRVAEDAIRPKMTVKNIDIKNGKTPSLTADLINEHVADIVDIYVVAVVYDGDNNAVGVSSTFVDYLPKGSSRRIFFNWLDNFQNEPSSVEIFPRVNILKKI